MENETSVAEREEPASICSTSARALEAERGASASVGVVIGNSTEGVVIGNSTVAIGNSTEGVVIGNSTEGVVIGNSTEGAAKAKESGVTGWGLAGGDNTSAAAVVCARPTKQLGPRPRWGYNRSDSSSPTNSERNARTASSNCMFS